MVGVNTAGFRQKSAEFDHAAASSKRLPGSVAVACLLTLQPPPNGCAGVWQPPRQGHTCRGRSVCSGFWQSAKRQGGTSLEVEQQQLGLWCRKQAWLDSSEDCAFLSVQGRKLAWRSSQSSGASAAVLSSGWQSLALSSGCYLHMASALNSGLSSQFSQVVHANTLTDAER